MHGKTTMSHATLHAIHHCDKAQAITRKHEWPHIKMMTNSHNWQVKCMSTSRQTHCKCITHTTWWNTCPLYGNDPPVILMHSRCINSVHTCAHHDEFRITLLLMRMVVMLYHTHVHTRAHSCNTQHAEFRIHCELPSTTTEVHSHAHAAYVCTLWYHDHTITITWRYPHRCRNHM